MRSLIYRTHIWLGVLVALPLLAWSSSGLLYAWPNAVEGGKVETIARDSVTVSPDEALRRADEFAEKKLPATALTLLMKDGRPVYQAVGGMGADSLLIDAQTGQVIRTPPPGIITRYFRQAHFYFFAGAWQIPLLITTSGLAFLSALSGLYLNIGWWLAKFRKRAASHARQKA